ncbi:MAG: hypothetical protein OXU20_28015 [Myxococcales bacterium]|nr:hypothetical protein [Myxococcales bacterium]
MDYLYDGPARARTRLILAHGAGAAMDTPFMNHIAEGVAAAGIRVVRFEFPYMAARRSHGTRRGPDRAAVLTETWQRAVTDHQHAGRLFVGGKSMGGRYASMICDDAQVDGLVCLGYPFHAPGKPDKPRVEHLATLKTPGLIIQGTRDSMGKPEDVEAYTLAKRIKVSWIEDGDHSLKPTKRSGRTHPQALDEAVAAVTGFIGKP